MILKVHLESHSYITLIEAYLDVTGVENEESTYVNQFRIEVERAYKTECEQICRLET